MIEALSWYIQYAPWSKIFLLLFIRTNDGRIYNKVAGTPSYGGGEGGKTKNYFSTFNFIDSQRQNSICLLIIYAN